MAGPEQDPNPGKRLAIGVVAIVLAAWQTGPAAASPSTPALCDDVADVALEIPAHGLQATAVSHEMNADAVVATAGAEKKSDTASPAQSAVPQNGADLRKALSDKRIAVLEKKAAELPLATTPAAIDDQPPAVHAQVPGVSDDELARYKRRMHRNDI